MESSRTRVVVRVATEPCYARNPVNGCGRGRRLEAFGGVCEAKMVFG
jgi:hypothetical protein